MAHSCLMASFRPIAVRMLCGIMSALPPGLLLATLAIGSATANVCRSIEAELAGVSRPPSQRERQAAAQAAYEAQRLRAHMNAIGCDRQPLLFLGPQPPAECRAYRAQAAQLQAQAQAAASPHEERRQQLVALLASNGCTAGPGPRRSPPRCRPGGTSSR